MAFLESLDTEEVILNLEGDRFEEKKLRMCNNGIEICGNKNFCTFPEYNEFVRLNLNFCRFCRHSPFIAINNEPENFKLNVNDRQNIEKLFLHHNDKLLIFDFQNQNGK
ncbi:hypothetical protein MHBO_003408 [Bonamia ostreae]|uniref:Uncharacterized protein n=1 Tax=Bonamia ostreae TaxID=126728 RepID=A0ABV2AQC3_9EUKA